MAADNDDDDDDDDDDGQRWEDLDPDSGRKTAIGTMQADRLI